jgi:hypothetical protein
MKVHVDIADPATVDEVRAGGQSRVVCSMIFRREDARAIQTAASAVQRASSACGAAIRADAAKLTSPADARRRQLLLDEAGTFDSTMSDDIDPLVLQTDVIRTGLEADLLRASQNRAVCDAAPQYALRLLNYDAHRRELIDSLDGFTKQIAGRCGDSDKVRESLAPAARSVATAKSIVAEGSLVTSDYAYAVSSLSDNYWRPFNVADGVSQGGNLDVAIKMNEPGDFTIKGMRFDATKVAQIVSKSFVQMLLLSAGHVGQGSGVTQSSSTQPLALGPHAGLAGQQAHERQRQAAMAAYRRSAIELALQVAAEFQHLGGTQAQRDDAIAAIKSAVDAHSPRLTLEGTPSDDNK